MALITATDSSPNEAPRQRFATVLISKVSNSSESNGDINNNANDRSNSADSDANTPKVIKVVSQRLWAFRPSF